MGNFFSSPQQRASENLYNSALSGNPIGANLLRGEYSKEVSALEGNTSNRASGLSGDILSRIASQGGAPGSGSEGVINKSLSPLWASEQMGEVQLGANLDKSMLELSMNDLSAGLSGMSSSSTFGDILGGLSTFANIGGGLSKLLFALKGLDPSALDNKGTEVKSDTNTSFG